MCLLFIFEFLKTSGNYCSYRALSEAPALKSSESAKAMDFLNVGDMVAYIIK